MARFDTRWALAAAGVLLVAACSENERAEDEAAEPAADEERGEDAAQADPEAAGDDEAADRAAADAIELTPEQVGPLEPGASVDAESLKGQFPGFEVARADVSREGTPIPGFELSVDGEAQLQVLLTKRGRIDDVIVLGDRVATPEGLSVGASYEELTGAYGAVRCRRGVENYGESLLCSPVDHKNIRWVFPVDIGEVSARGDTPPRRAKAALEGRQAREVHWSAPEGAAVAEPSVPEEPAGGDAAELPEEAVAVMKGVRAAAAARDWERLEGLMSDRFTTQVDPKREPRAKALEAWKQEPSAMDHLVSLIDARGKACEYNEGHEPQYTFIECSLRGNPYRIVFKKVEGEYRFTHMMGARV